jgi:transposase
MSRHSTSGGDGAALIELAVRLRAKIDPRSPGAVRVIAIEEAGLDGFWVHRLLEANSVESHVVDAASIAVPRRRRRAKTDAIDGETLLRTLLAWQRANLASARWLSRRRPSRKISGEHRASGPF